MLLLPADIIALLGSFAPLFSRRTWRHVPNLVAGAILAPGWRMVSSALRAVGLGQVCTFQTYHRMLNRVSWFCTGLVLLAGSLLTIGSAMRATPSWPRSTISGLSGCE
jgi:hypothetical protein